MRSHSKALFAVAALFTLLLLAPAASAATKGTVNYFGSSGDGNGQFGADSGSPVGIAVNDPAIDDGNDADGRVYVFDGPAGRIQVFDSDGTFLFKFGSPGTGAGQFDDEEAGQIAIDQQQGWLYVADSDNYRVQKFDADGNFLLMWGYGVQNGAAELQVCAPPVLGCQAGIAGSTTAAPGGQFLDIFRGSVALDPDSGNVYVSDPAARRVQEFTSAGSFVRLWGWDVHGINERQQVTINATGGTFRLCKDVGLTECSANLNFNASGSQVATALVTPAMFGAGNVAGAGSSTQPKVLTFQGALSGTDVNQLIVDTAGLTGGGATVETLANGAGGNFTGFEICSEAALCKPAAAAGTDNGRFSNNSPLFIAVDDEGILYASDVGSGAAANRILRFDTDAATASEMLSFLPAGNGAIQQAAPPTAASPLMTGVIRGLAIDTASDNLLVVRDPTAANVAGLNTPANPTAETWVQEVDDPGAALSPQPAPNPTVVDNHAQGEGWIGNTSSGSSLGFVNAIATDPNSGAAYVTRSGAKQVAVLDNGVLPSVALNPTTANSATSATFNAKVDPNGSLTRYHFEYRLCPGGVCGAGGYTSVPVPDASLGMGDVEFSLARTVTGLVPNSTYEARIVVDGYGGAPVIVPAPPATGQMFLTPAVSPSATTRPAVPLTDTTAQLQARINPNNQATTYRFEWDADAGAPYANSIPASPGPEPSAGAGSEPLTVVAQLSGLSPATTYHYRVVATNTTGSTNGADVAFVTTGTPNPPPAPPAGCPNEALRTGASAQLPECRAYEMVTPPDKSIRRGGPGDSGQRYVGSGLPSASGDSVLHVLQLGVLDNPGGGFGDDFNRLKRTPGGWIVQPIMNRPAVNSGLQTFLLLLGSNTDQSLGAWKPTVPIFPEQSSPSAPRHPAYTRFMDGDPSWADYPGWAAWDIENDPGAAATASEVALFTEDGRYLFRSHPIRGLLGPSDPSLEMPDAESPTIYRQRLSDGAVELVNECTGLGAGETPSPDATLIPERDDNDTPGDLSDDKVGAQSCAAGELTSLRGAVLGGGQLQVDGGSPAAGPVARAASADGGRTFFTSPDPKSSGTLGRTPNSCTTATGPVTDCPPQLYVRQYHPAGGSTVRWISRPLVSGQDIALLGTGAAYEAASKSGHKVFFRTNAPLVPGDPNGAGTPPPLGGVKTGVASANSWDLYQYELPADPDADPDEGVLTRISAGPTGAGDPNLSCGAISPSTGDCVGATGSGAVPPSTTVPGGQGASVRHISEDGSKVYFLTASPIPGVATNDAPTSGTVAAATGQPRNAATRNLYLYDSTKQGAARWEFIASIPHSVARSGASMSLDTCASAAPAPAGAVLPNGEPNTSRSCFFGSPDGETVAFMTSGRLTADDADSAFDVYAYDAAADRLSRVSAPPPGATAYDCVWGSFAASVIHQCNADTGPVGPNGFALTAGPTWEVPRGPAGLRDLNVSPDGSVHFESRLELLPADDDGTDMDVYRWRDGELSLLSPGIENDDAFFGGANGDGSSIFMATSATLDPSREIDADFDVYVARVGGGFPPLPGPPAACEVLADGCQPSSAPPAIAAVATAAGSGPGNVTEKARKARRCAKGKVRRGKRCVTRKQKKQRRAKRAADKTGRASR